MEPYTQRQICSLSENHLFIWYIAGQIEHHLKFLLAWLHYMTNDRWQVDLQHCIILAQVKNTQIEGTLIVASNTYKMQPSINNSQLPNDFQLVSTIYLVLQS